MTDDRPTDEAGTPPRPEADGAPRPEQGERKEHEAAFMDEYGYRVLAGLTVLLLTVGTVVYHAIEDWTWVDSFYFSSVAVTTVGFGDLTPSSDVSKLFTVAYIFSGIAIITSFLNLRLRRGATTIARRRKAHRGLWRYRSPDRPTDGGGPETGPTN